MELDQLCDYIPFRYPAFEAFICASQNLSGSTGVYWTTISIRSYYITATMQLGDLLEQERVKIYFFTLTVYKTNRGAPIVIIKINILRTIINVLHSGRESGKPFRPFISLRITKPATICSHCNMYSLLCNIFLDSYSILPFNSLSLSLALL